MNKMYQFKISLNYSDPVIWRQVLVPTTFSFKDLHKVIQVLFDWDEAHMHEFNAGKAFRGEKISDRIPLAIYFERPKQKANYTYDFGDSWEHEIAFEQWADNNKNITFPVCIAGENQAPPEDCGGIPALEALQDKKHPDRKNIIEWLEEDFDPAFFDMNRLNAQLKRIKEKKSK